MIKLPNLPQNLMTAVATNFIAQVWGVVVSIIFVPLYLHYLGAEGYGVVGFSTTLLAIVALLDGGLTLTVNRQMAQLSQDNANAGRMREILSAATALFLAIAILIVAVIGLGAPWVAHHWLNANSLSSGEIVLSVRLIGLLLGEQIMLALFQGAMFGLHRQELTNMVSVAASTLRAVGAILVLKYVHPAPSIFFTWYALTLLLQIVSLRIATGAAIGGERRAQLPRLKIMRTLLRSTAGLGAITILSLLLSQIDKLIVSRLLTLQDFGYYMIAVSVSMVPLLAAGPVTNAFFPRLTRLAQSDLSGAIAMLHLMTQTIAGLVAPVGWLFAFFSHEIIFLWTGNAALTAHIAPLTTILGAGYAINASLQSAYYFEMAFARTRSIVAMNMLAVAFVLPAIVIFGRLHGGLGVAACWFALNVFYLLIGCPLVLRKGLGSAVWSFYVRDLLPCYAATGVTVGLARLIAPPGLPRFTGGAVLIAAGAAAFVACCLTAPDLRTQTNQYVRRLFAPTPKAGA